MNAETTPTKRYCRYCGARLMVDVKALKGKMVLEVKCTKCKHQNIIEEENN